MEKIPQVTAQGQSLVARALDARENSRKADQIEARRVCRGQLETAQAKLIKVGVLSAIDVDRGVCDVGEEDFFFRLSEYGDLEVCGFCSCGRLVSGRIIRSFADIGDHVAGFDFWECHMCYPGSRAVPSTAEQLEGLFRQIAREEIEAAREASL